MVHQGRDVVLVTPTASGKTLCYNIPVLQKIIEEPETRAIYLFPTKALANDQMTEVHHLIGELKADIKTFTYDGDTPDDARQAIRKQGHVVVTNPDMLHAGILPHHTKWQKLFSNLKYVVVDELHTYRGVFGSHVTNVFRRLKRVCRFYGQDPIFICCSATVANPKEHAEDLIEKEIVLIDESGAPRSAKTFILYNPPVVNRELGIRQSSLTPARNMMSDLIGNKIQTIAFTTSRLSVEVLTKYLKDTFGGKIPNDDHYVTGYRGGYLPNLRRQIEKGLRERTVMGVVSTNALELGIDIGDLEACIMVGYPGSIASTWQQAGRAGRRAGQSLAILIARSNPMDQFIVENPDYFFARSPEHCRVNPDNLLILLHHIKSAAFELPFEEGERVRQGRPHGAALLPGGEGCAPPGGQALALGGRELSGGRSKSLRTINPENVVVVDTTDAANHKVIAEVDWDSAFTTVHDDAIYMVESQQYHVDKLDLERKKAYVEKGGRGLLHRRHDLHRCPCHRRLRQEDERQDHRGARRGPRLPQGGGLQEDQVLHLGERRLRRHTPAREGDAHHELLVHHPLGPAQFIAAHPLGYHRRPRRARLLPPPHLGHARHGGHPRRRLVHRRQER